MTIFTFTCNIDSVKNIYKLIYQLLIAILFVEYSHYVSWGSISSARTCTGSVSSGV